MQAKHVSMLDILRVIADAPTWCTWRRRPEGQTWHATPIPNALPYEVPPKVLRAKLRIMIKRGVITGCACGCRGDFEITDKGRIALIHDAASIPEGQERLRQAVEKIGPQG